MITKTRLFFLTLVILMVAYFWPREQFNPGIISGQLVLVTGASSGIGEQLAYQYAKAGASVFVTARRANLLSKVVENCERLGLPGARFGSFPADMSDMSQAAAVIKEAVSYMGGLNQLILNHAYIPKVRPFDESEESLKIIEKSLDVNVRSFAHLTWEALPYLQQTNGSIGVISSIAGKFGLPLFAPYAASKFALDGLFSSLRAEFKRFNVSVTLAVLGGIGTEGLYDILRDMKENYKNLKDIKDTRWTPASPSGCAYEIMRGTTNREREIYFPKDQYIGVIVFFREILVRLSSTLQDGLNDLLKNRK